MGTGSIFGCGPCVSLLSGPPLHSRGPSIDRTNVTHKSYNEEANFFHVQYSQGRYLMRGECHLTFALLGEEKCVTF
jgi:hypothetical protein